MWLSSVVVAGLWGLLFVAFAGIFVAVYLSSKGKDTAAVGVMFGVIISVVACIPLALYGNAERNKLLNTVLESKYHVTHRYPNTFPETVTETFTVKMEGVTGPQTCVLDPDEHIQGAVTMMCVPTEDFREPPRH